MTMKVQIYLSQWIVLVTYEQYISSIEFRFSFTTNEKRRYLIQCTHSISVMTFTKYAQGRIFRKQNNLNKRQRIQKVQSKMDNPEKLSTQGKHKTKKNKIKTQHNMCWTPLYASKHKFNKLDMNLPTNNWRLRRTEHRFYVDIVMGFTSQNSERKNI